MIPTGHVTRVNLDEDDDKASVERSLESKYDRRRRRLLRQSTHRNNGRWKEELRRYLNDMAPDVNKDLDVVSWWAVSHFRLYSHFLCSKQTVQLHAKEYPTLACIAKDVCAIPATSVQCERLFSAGAEIATDC